MADIYQIQTNRTNSNILGNGMSSLFDLNIENLINIDQQTITFLFCNDLKSLLETSDLRELIKKLNQLDQLLIQYREEEVDQDLPHLDDFFRILSPLLLRSVSQTLDSISKDEKINLNTNGEESLLMGWLESLRISIEEEIHIWQEKLI
mgnify:CR=1 FL=1